MELNIQQICEQLEDAELLPIFLLEAIDYLQLLYQEQSLSKTQWNQLRLLDHLFS